MMNCRESTALLSESQDRALTFKERVSLRLHLFFCSGCTQFKLHLHDIHYYLGKYFSNKS
ncbi:MAG: zf-HC2 domain-containing protein [Betaproteobacteria bacterium]|nr:zf-HC2 domain-containing protein [Betaproteobacteria bacterium]MDE2424035.1 zf-HC2 domain-containing protein [Betaproteobacteria bacterium]